MILLSIGYKANLKSIRPSPNKRCTHSRQQFLLEGAQSEVNTAYIKFKINVVQQITSLNPAKVCGINEESSVLDFDQEIRPVRALTNESDVFLDETLHSHSASLQPGT